MEKWIKIGAIVLIGAVGLWIAFQVIQFVIGLIWSLILLAAGLLILAILLYVAYMLLSNMGGGSSSKSESRERIYE